MKLITSRIVQEARSWIGTSFCHQGRVKQNACDCIGLIIGVARHIGARSLQGGCLHEYDLCNYTRIPTNNILENALDDHMVISDSVSVGNVAYSH